MPYTDEKDLKDEDCTSNGAHVCVSATQIATCQIWETGTGAYVTSSCPNTTICGTYNDVTECFLPCSAEKVGKKVKLCDPENLDEDGWFPVAWGEYECKKVGDNHLFVYAGKYEHCGSMQFCNDVVDADGDKTGECGN